MSGFYGDVMRWWVGVVEEIATDIDKLGKVKVRIYGVHDDAKKYLLMIYHMPNV